MDPSNYPLVIGLTGGIASGKSTVSGLFKTLGAEIIDADIISRALVEPGSQILKELSALFGPEIINDDGSLNRKELGAIVFSDKKKLDSLNRLMFPRIKAVICSWLMVRGIPRRRLAEAEGEDWLKTELLIEEFEIIASSLMQNPVGEIKVIVIDAAILVEAELFRFTDFNVLVTADFMLRLERLIKRTGLPRDLALDRLRSQISDAERMKHCDYVIDNSGSEDQLRILAKETWEDLMKYISQSI